MVDWADVKRGAQAAVQDTFGIFAEYVAPGSGSWTLTKIRIHTRAFRGGDSDNVGFVEHFEEGVRISLLDDRITPVRGAVLTLPSGESYTLLLRVDTNDAGVQFWDAKLND